MAISETEAFIRDNERFLVSTHLNPDGDGIGAAMAMKWLLVKLSKKAEIVLESDAPESLDFFQDYQWVLKYGKETEGMEKFSSVIMVDAPSMERAGDAANLIEDGAGILNVDHHVSNERFGTVNLIDLEAASSTQIVHEIIRELGVFVDPACAEYLFTGLVIDTGRFRFSNTTADTFRSASELVAAGAVPSRITERLFYYKTLETTRALGKFINSIDIHLNGLVATAQFDHDYILSDEWRNTNSEGFVNHALSIQGVEVAMFLREVEKGVTRASLRAKNDFDVNRLAGVFGGGGHAKAAGCTIRSPLAQAKAKLLDSAAAQMEVARSEKIS